MPITRGKRLRALTEGIVGRVEYAMAVRGQNQQDLVRELRDLTGWHGSSSVSQWFKRRTLPQGPVTAALPRALGVRSEWLFWNELPMDPPEEAGRPDEHWIRGGQYAVAAVDRALLQLRSELAEMNTSELTGQDAADRSREVADLVYRRQFQGPAPPRRYRQGGQGSQP
jgi:hypothetical protein